MNVIYENIQRLCKERQTNYNRLCDDLGLSYGVISNLKQCETRVLRADIVLRIAKYLDVPYEWILLPIEDIKEQTTQEADDLSDIEKELLRCWREASQDERENVAYVLRKHGMPFPEKGTEQSQSGLAV